MLLWQQALESDLFGRSLIHHPWHGAGPQEAAAGAAAQVALAAHSVERMPGMCKNADGSTRLGFDGTGMSVEQLIAEPVRFTPSVSRFICFVTHDAGRQMIGSFHPKDGDFFKDAYQGPPAAA